MPDHRATPDANRGEAAADRGDWLVTKSSPWSVSDTVARLTGVVAARGMKLFAVIDHSGEAEAADSSCATPRSSSLAAASRNARDARCAARGARSAAEGPGVG